MAREKPFIVTGLGKNTFRMDIVLPDFVGLLSVITGLFASAGLSIQSGKITTVEGVARDSFTLLAREHPDWQQLEDDLIILTQKARKGNLEEVRSEIHSRLMRYFRSHQDIYSERLYPIELSIDQNLAALETVVDIQSQDTPAFLYELTNALSLLEINIVAMEIQTAGGEIQDRLWLTYRGQKIISEEKLRALQWAILLIKQFTHLLPRVPDPFTALEHFAQFGKDMFSRSDFASILLKLRKPGSLDRMSRVLGTSQFLWEEFIRYQYASIIPILERQELLKKKKTKAMMQKALKRLLGLKRTFDEKVESLNQYKDREMFRIDLRHIVGQVSYLGEFAGEFTELVEVVAEAAYRLAWEETLKRFEPPKVSESRESEAALFGLGKFGGEELGYASDVEIMFVYNDDPDSASERSQANLAFYTEIVRLFRKIIRARSEGVFEIDLRLRPYGKDGPLAVSLALFQKYYSPQGEAWDFERQALVKLRYVGGSQELGREVERLRDGFVYGPKPFDLQEALRLRRRQQDELVKKGTANAKYSAGGLLDVEYLVQTLQIAFGRHDHGDLRSPQTLKALQALWQDGILPGSQFHVLRASYVFLRSLINALRIVRGHAKDLTIPDEPSGEFVMLARRIGYKGKDETLRQALKEDLAHYRKAAANLYEAWMKRLAEEEWSRLEVLVDREPRPLSVSLDDLLRGDISHESASVLESVGFQDIPLLVQRLKRICPKALAFESFSRVIEEAWKVWPGIGDPDSAVMFLERLLDVQTDPEGFWYKLAAHRRGCSMVLNLFGSSAYLSEQFIRFPQAWKWIENQSELSYEASRLALIAQADQTNSVETLKAVRHFETLRMALSARLEPPQPAVLYETFSYLADFILENLYRLCFEKKTCCILALGKLGGRELNFSSDVDLMFLSSKGDDLTAEIQEFLKQLQESGAGDMLYRADLRLRPHGQHGALFLDSEQYEYYYAKEADVWEYQALIKARPVAGRKDWGVFLLGNLEAVIWRREWTAEELARLREIKHRFEAMTRARGEWESNVKMGRGGIRDVEFSVQILQLLHGRAFASLREAHTLRALEEIGRLGLMTEHDCISLKNGYIFTRRAEDYLQLFENRRVFNIPEDEKRLQCMAKSLGYKNDAAGSAKDKFVNELGRIRDANRMILEKTFFQA